MLARQAAEAGEVPVGAVIVHHASGEVVAAAHNEVELQADATAHAEMLAIRRATAAIGSKSLKGYALYVSLEPCPMCAAAISFARLDRVYFGAYDPKSVGVEHGTRFFSSSSCHHAPEVYGGILESECAVLLKTFFVGKR
jgi:tRNA(Arg) A34 adenosine deaminase TadA